jgi:hypothetical protein
VAVVGVEADHQLAQVVLFFPFPFLSYFSLAFFSYFTLVIGIVDIDQLILNLRPFSTKSLSTVILLKTLLTIVLIKTLLAVAVVNVADLMLDVAVHFLQVI